MASEREKKYWIREYNKSVLDKIKNTQIYTYCYKLDSSIDLWKDRETFNDYYKKVSNLQMGIMIDEASITNKLFGDYIESWEDEYYKEIFKNVPPEWIAEEREKLNLRSLETINYEILYKYNIIATKEIIKKVEEQKTEIDW